MPSSSSFLRRTTTLLLEFLVVLLLNSAGHPSVNNCSDLEPYLNPNNASSHHVNNIKPALDMLNLDGHFDFNNTYLAASDFGNRVHFLPAAILYPTSVSDISRTIKYVFQMGPASELTVAARGHGHSLRGQSQAENGIVINMQSLAQKMHVHTAAAGKLPYVDVSGGDLWINVLRETLRYGLSPKSWTDYLHLTIGGTLSNAGVSGQAFRHGPQIENVYQLEVVTGRGDVVICSEKQNADLFYGVLGGLGQFGIITRARIALEPAPQMVKWIRVLYSDFDSFTKDQELLISSGDSFNYVEGFVIINRTGLLNSWRLSFNPKDPVQAKQFRSEGRTLYCLEVAKYFNLGDDGPANNKAEDLLSRLNYLKHTLFQTEVSYIEFLDRVHLSEIKLREKGLWDVPHPWLNVLVPQRSIRRFAKEVFGNILTDSSNGPILLYPVNQSTWNNRTSMVTPVEEVFYLVAILPSSMPTLTGSDELEHILAQNRRILQLCEDAKLGVKQYLAFHKTQERWRAHFGPKWAAFARRKSIYDPLAILAPGQGIFKKQGSSGQQSSL